MTRLPHYVVLIAAAAMLCGLGAPASAETKIAVVDVQKIMRDSSAAKSIRSQLESKQKAFQAEIKKKEEEMQAQEKSLAGQRATLSPEAFEKKVNEFRTKATKMQKDVQAKKSSLDSGFEKSLNDIQQVVNQVITDLAKEKSFNLAIPSGQLLYAEPGMDITAEVLSRLNSKLPKVTVTFK